MNNRQMLILSGLMLIGLFVCILAAVLVFSQGDVAPLAGLFNSNQPVVRIFIQAPPLTALDEDIKMVVTINNLGENYLQIDEIRLPQALMNATIVTAVIPGTTNQINYGDSTGFQIGFVLAPGASQAFEITLRTLSEADVMGQVQVMAGGKIAESGFRMVINQALALEPTPTWTPTVTPSLTPTLLPTLTPTATPVAIPYQAVVKIVAKIKSSSRLRDAWGGSGTIISPDGLILTNAHVADPLATVKADALVIALTDDPSQSPEERYIAKVLVVDHDLDLAVIVIDTDMKYFDVDRSKLNLPYLQLGDSDTVQLGDPLTILGYPAIGGDTITLTNGEVGGFTSEKEYGDRAFIKTAANITGGTSGGLAMDRLGYMIGVPTQLGNGQRGELLDCRVLVDTNGDGDVDQRDQCVPVGGFINALRPINLALPLIEEAKKTLK